MPSALIIYWTISLMLNYTLPDIVFKKKIYSFYTIILTPYFLIKIESVYDILNILFWWFVAGATPVLIPNTAVKSSTTDGTHLLGRVGRRQLKAFK